MNGMYQLYLYFSSKGLEGLSRLTKVLTPDVRLDVRKISGPKLTLWAGFSFPSNGAEKKMGSLSPHTHTLHRMSSYAVFCSRRSFKGSEAQERYFSDFCVCFSFGGGASHKYDMVCCRMR